MADEVTISVPDQYAIKGEDGFSPVVTVTQIAHGHEVTITDALGDHPFNVMDGASAYDLARAGGYTGTETEFIALLAGIQNSSQTISALAALIVPANDGKVIGIVNGALAAVSGGAAYPDGDGVSY